MTHTVSVSTLRDWLFDNEELALFDVREHGLYGEGHLFHAVPLPLSVLEQHVQRLAPNRAVRLVVYDEGRDDGLQIAARAAAQLHTLGYTNIHVLEGGALAWSEAGHVLFKGVNLPSKAFGELVEQANHTPSIQAADLWRAVNGETPPRVFDGRPFSEFRKMSLPNAQCCPNGELAFRMHALVPDPHTPIVINCAGRTRSIIGAQTLINLGIPNPVVALEDGTQGWHLQDLPLERGQQATLSDDTALTGASVHVRDTWRKAAEALAARAGVAWVDAETAATWAHDRSRSVFLCDVRSAEEFAAKTLPGAQHAPGGQLQQATDQYVGVRNAHIVLFDSDDVRALVTASWLGQMGHRAFVLRGGVAAVLPLPPQPHATPPAVAGIDAAALRTLQQSADVHLIDLRSSQAFRDANLPGSHWVSRAVLPSRLRALSGEIVLIADDAVAAGWAVSELPVAERSRVRLLAGGLAAWRDSGGEVIASPTVPSDADRIDFLFFVHDRHDGNKQAAQAYLTWEKGLLAQLDPRDLAQFRPLSPEHA